MPELSLPDWRLGCVHGVWLPTASDRPNEKPRHRVIASNKPAYERQREQPAIVRAFAFRSIGASLMPVSGVCIHFVLSTSVTARRGAVLRRTATLLEELPQLDAVLD